MKWMWDESRNGIEVGTHCTYTYQVARNSIPPSFNNDTDRSIALVEPKSRRIPFFVAVLRQMRLEV